MISSGYSLYDDKRASLITLSQFVLRKEADRIREDLHKNAIEAAIFLGTKENEYLSLVDLEKTLQTKLLGIRLHSSLIEQTINSLEREHKIEKTSDNRLRIIANRRVQLQQYRLEQEAIAKKVEKDLSEAISKEYALLTNRVPKPSNLVEALDVFYSFLSSLLGEKGNFVAGVLSGSQELAVFSIPSEILRKAASILTDTSLKGAVIKAIEDAFHDASMDLTKYILTITQNFICLRILNLDPLCQKLEGELFSRQTMFLDTNVLIAIACEGDMSHKLVIETLKFARNLGVNVVFSQKTAAEFSRVLENSNRRYKELNVPQRILDRVEDPFIASFAVEHKSNPSQTWEGYYSRNKEIVGVLKKVYDVNMHKINNEEIENLSWYADVTAKVVECFELMRGFPKTYEVAAHDSLHMLFVKESRKDREKGALGPDYWFLTQDRTLRCAEQEINVKGAYSDKASVIMECNLWLDLMTPFLNISAQREILPAYSELLRSELPTVTPGIDPDALRLVQGEWLKYDWLRTEDIEKILHQKFVSEYESKVAAVQKEGKDVQPLMEQLKKEINSHVGNMFNEKVTELKREQQQTVEHLDTQIKDLRSNLANEQKMRNYFRIITGILGGALILGDLTLLFTIPNPSPQTTIICLGTLVAGVVLMLIAVAHEQVKASILLRLPTGQ